MNYERMLNEYKRLNNEIDFVKTQLAPLPEGNIFCTRNGTHYKWYHSAGKKQTYIPKENRHFAEQLALKKYLTLRLKELLREKNAVELYLRHHTPFPGKSTELLESGAYQELLRQYFTPLSKELCEWASAPYECSTKYPEYLVHRTSSGNIVRSKSEALIDMVLYNKQIPFRYECALHLGDTTIYPDFTIRHPRTGKTYYWEHFGMMDDPAYSRGACSKLQLYITHGIIPSIQLITTYETAEAPLSSHELEKIVENYFLQ